MSLMVSTDKFEEEVLKSDKPVLVDFWATWCGPCQMMAPVVDELSEELKDSVKVCKVNVDENPELAQQFGIMSIPNFILFKDGKIAGTKVGAVGKDGLLSLING